MSRQFSYNLLNIISRLINFVLFLVVVNKYGASREMDWFFFLYGLVYFIISTLFYSIESALVPSWPKMDTYERSSFLDACIKLGRIGGVILIVCGLAFSIWVPKKLGFNSPYLLNKTIIISILLFIQPFLAFNAALYSSLLQAAGKYFWPITHLSFRAIGILFFLSLPLCNSIMCLVFSFTFGEVTRAIALYFAGRGEAKRISSSTLKDDFQKFKKQFMSVSWMILMILASSSNAYIDFIMVGNFGEGNATLVEYAGRLRGLPMLALNGFLVVFLGDWSHLALLTWQKVRQGTWQVFFYGLVLCISLILTMQLWLPMIFREVIFQPTQQVVLKQLMGWYLTGAIFMIAGNVISRAFLVWHRFRLMSILSGISVLINIVLNISFINFFGVTGVAISTAGLDLVMLFIFIYFGKKIAKERVMM